MFSCGDRWRFARLGRHRPNPRWIWRTKCDTGYRKLSQYTSRTKPHGQRTARKATKKLCVETVEKIDATSCIFQKRFVANNIPRTKRKLIPRDEGRQIKKRLIKKVNVSWAASSRRCRKMSLRSKRCGAKKTTFRQFRLRCIWRGRK